MSSSDPKAEPQPAIGPAQTAGPPLVVLLGPTAVGKTEISIRLAELLGAEIVSADSRLLYRGMDIGTAKPSRQERNRVVHHLIDVARPDQTWSLARYQGAAFATIGAIQRRGGAALLVGGTGQYIRAVAQGWQIPPQRPTNALRTVLERWGSEIGPEKLHRGLAVLDPQAAQGIEPRNLRRTVRALEVILSTGRLFSAQSRRAVPRFRVLQLGLYRPRDELYARIDRRIESMLQAGLVAEVAQLLGQGYPADLPAFSAIGYRETIAYLRGELSLEAAVAAMKRNTRQFVRRQANWFKADDPAIRWFRAADQVQTQLYPVVAAFLDA